MWDPKTRETTTIGELDVFQDTKTMSEEGLLGLALDGCQHASVGRLLEALLQPAEAQVGEVLRPFEIGDRDAAGVQEGVR